MTKKLTLGAIAAIGALLASGATVAQNDDAPVFVPVDLFACSYNEGKGPADLDAVITGWNEYMDKKRIRTYAAWTLTKHYYGPEQEFDMLWIGASKDAHAMGEGADAYLADGGDSAAGFEAVLHCDVAANFASVNPVPPAGGKTPGDGVMTFSDCTMKEGARNSDVSEAMVAWGKALKDAGVESGIYHWYPVFGGGDADYDFKWVEAHANHAAFGKFYETMGNGGLYLKQEELFGDLLDCDVNRVYNATNRRKAQVR